MHIFTVGNDIGDWFETAKLSGRSGFTPLRYLGVSGCLYGPHGTNSTDQEVYLKCKGYLNPNTAPWDFGIRRKDFIAFVEAGKLAVSMITSVETKLSAQPTKTGVLEACTFDSDDLDVTIAAIGGGIVRVTTQCRGKSPCQLHITTWGALVLGTWRPPTN